MKPHYPSQPRPPKDVNDAVFCSGGGFVSNESGGKLLVDGASTDYGAGDHATAKAALSAAVRNSGMV